MLRLFVLSLFVLAALPFTSFSQDLPANLQGQDIPIVAFNEQDLQNPGDWKSQFDNVIWINKSVTGHTAQSLRFYVHGQLILNTLISSGRERIESADSHAVHAPKQTYFSTTPTGYYSPQSLEVLHRSGLWSADMPYAIFFYGGVALHQAPAGTESRLGTRASGGCVRAPHMAALTIFNQVKSSGMGAVPMFTRSGQPFLQWGRQFQLQDHYRTLIIVEDRHD